MTLSFIGLDQTRGWFYTLTVIGELCEHGLYFTTTTATTIIYPSIYLPTYLSIYQPTLQSSIFYIYFILCLITSATALFDKPAFKNLIVNGLVLAADGKKMSKRLKNYPDPQIVLTKYGADALRLYLINSPVVRADVLKFQEEGIC